MFALRCASGIVLALVVGGLAGCSASSSPKFDPTTANPAVDKAVGADPQKPGAPSECPAATRPDVESGKCIPVGPSRDKVAGFARDAAGWGWNPVAPENACEGATLAVLGQTACQPLDDCAAAFPPPGADIVLDARAATPEARSKLLADAVARVRAGGTIALDEGDYGSAVIRKSVHVVGRCASKVKIRSGAATDHQPGDRADGSEPKGIDVPTAVDVELRSLTIEGFDFGVYADKPGGHVKIDRVVLSGNRAGALAARGASVEMSRCAVSDSPDFPRTDAMGVSVFFGSKVTLTDVEVRGMDTGLSVNSPGSELTVRRSIVGHQHTPVYRGAGLEAFRGAVAKVEESVITTEAGFCLAVGRFLGTPPKGDETAGAGAIEMKRSVLRHQGKATGDPKDREGILNLWDGAQLQLEDTTIRHRSFGAIAVQTGSSLTARRTAFIADPGDTPSREAMSVYDSGSSATLEDSAVVDASQVGLMVHGRGVSLTLRRSLITGTKHRLGGDLLDPGGAGQAIAAGDEARLEVEDSALTANQGIGLFGYKGAAVRVTRSMIDDTRATPRGHLGTGIFMASSSQLAISACSVRRNHDTGLAFHDASGMVTGTLVADNATAVRTSGGTTLVEAKTAPVDVEANRALLFDNRLERNATTFSDAEQSYVE